MRPFVPAPLFNQLLLTLGVLLGGRFCTVWAQSQPPLAQRVEGLLIGSLIGDAAGGPHEFQPPKRSEWTGQGRVLTAAGRRELARLFRLDPYEIPPAPYAHWRDGAPAGTVTDDSRFKVIFFESLKDAGRLSREAFARAMLEVHDDTAGPYGHLPRLWMDELAASARWILGQSESGGALPTERLWGGLPTMAGQMPFLPIAGMNPGEPERAYRAVWEVDFLDNGFALDMNAALVAGLSAALEPGASWSTVEAAMRSTDPFGYADVPWVPRRLHVWLDRAHDAARRARGVPSRLFAILEEELAAETWWEAWVPMTVVFACAELAAYDPLATMQLILEFGHDTDSHLQLAGALVGALHGAEIFPVEMRRSVESRLEMDYGARIDGWMRLLGHEREGP